MKQLTAAEIETMPERAHQHQFNINALRMTRTLGELTGLTSIGVHLIRLEPGRDSTQFHYHDSDEEFILILKGNGRARIGGSSFPVAPGDFMGFPTPSPAHSLHNLSDTDLLYLVGGESNPADVVHYPDIRRSMIKSYGRRSYVEWDNLIDLG